MHRCVRKAAARLLAGGLLALLPLALLPLVLEHALPPLVLEHALLPLVLGHSREFLLHLRITAQWLLQTAGYPPHPTPHASPS